MKNVAVTGMRRLRRRQAGFSLVEGLVALAILMTVVIGLIPLFTQSMINNTAGRHLTQATNFTTDSFEELAQLPLNNDLLDLPAGLPRVVRAQLISGREALDDSGAPRPGFEYSVLETQNVGDTTLPDDPDEVIDLAGFADEDALRSAKWIRIIEVEQFQISSLADGLAGPADTRFEDDERLPGGTEDSNVQLKKIEIRIIPRGANSGLSIGQGRVSATLVKAI
ncbi:MAG: prepilin-type N-terminal cleavage/methylation domain-containing protein [Acidobacteria bacterium]|nr:prepilin-type N-terminal cleavage/methylation domain-containing protein [Acidobacteriota bacterium]